jgi:ribose 5-phosphate isomerase A
LFLTDNGNAILDCRVGPILLPPEFEAQLRAIPGVVGTGLFLGMAETVLVGDENWRLVEEKNRA